MKQELDKKLNIGKPKKTPNAYNFNFDNDALNTRLSHLVERFSKQAVDVLDEKNVYKQNKQEYAEKFKKLYEELAYKIAKYRFRK